MIWTDVRGSTTVIAAVAIVGIAGVSAAALEMSRASAAATELQDLADSVALRTVRARLEGTNDLEVLRKDAERIALALMADKEPGASNARAEVSFGKDKSAVTVRLHHKVGMFGDVGGEATAVAEAGAPICLLVLDPAASGAWSMTGNATVQAPACAAQVNSASLRAIDSGGAAKVTTLRTLVVGSGKPLRGFTPAPAYGQPAVGDPYRHDLPWPQASHCDHDKFKAEGEASLQPGVYCGGLSVDTRATANLAPGVYVLKDGPLKVASHGVLNAPSGVTFVLTGSGGYVESRSGATLRMRAPTSGPWAGFVVAQAPGQDRKHSSVVIGNGDVDVEGVIYLPTQRMMISGAGEGFVAGLIVNTLDMRGNGRLRLSPGIHAPMLPPVIRLDETGGEEPPPPGGPG
jgi:hypothetical protein